jgi:hypothetical protein
VERTLDVPSKATLPEVHELLQAAMGWVDVHLHEFLVGGTHYGIPDPDGFDDSALDETRVGLGDLGPEWTYHYDFGDGWLHDVEVLGRGGDRAGCVDGRGGCPLEDCGGPPGHEQLRLALADPHHRDHDTLLTWSDGGFPGFDLEATDRRVRHTAGAVPESVRLLLAAIGEGVTLTPGGRLPRRTVRQIQEHRSHWSISGKPASFEEDLIPLAALHDLLREVGLLRLRKGVLTPIRAADDDVEVLRRLRSWFDPTDGFVAQLATDAVALLIADGPLEHRELRSGVLELLGPRWARGGSPISAEDVGLELARLRPVLEGLDQIERGGPSWRPGPGASWLFPRAVALAELANHGTPATQPHYRWSRQRE